MLLKDYKLLLVLGLSLLLNLSIWVLSWYHFPSSSAAILHYSTAVGIDSYGDSRQIITLPKIGSVLLLVNTFLGFILRPVDQRAAWIAWGINPVIQAILLGAYWLIWQANQ